MEFRKNLNRGYRNLAVWQKSVELFVHVDAICGHLRGVDPRLRSQLRNAAQSVSANIAEGYCRRGINEYRQFLYIALGSLGELFTRLTCLHKAGLLSDPQFETFDALHYHVENMVIRLIRSLQVMKKEGLWNDVIRECGSQYVSANLPSGKNSSARRGSWLEAGGVDAHTPILTAQSMIR